MNMPSRAPSHSSATPTLTSPLVLLPPELRLQIYNLVLSAPSQIPSSSPSQYRLAREARRTTISLLLVNKLIHREYVPLFHNSFTYKVQISPTGPYYFQSPNVTVSSPWGVRAETLREMRKWEVEVLLGGKGDDVYEQLDEGMGMSYDGVGEWDGVFDFDRRKGERERKCKREWMNVRTWLRGWCVVMMDAGVELEHLDVVVFGAGWGGERLKVGELGDGGDFLAPVRELRAGECSVELKTGEWEGTGWLWMEREEDVEQQKYAESVAGMVVGDEGKGDPKPHRLLTEIKSFARTIRTATEAFDLTIPAANRAQRKAHAALRCLEFDTTLSLPAKIQLLYEAYTLVLQHASSVKEDLDERDSSQQAPATVLAEGWWNLWGATGNWDRLEKLEDVEQMREWFHIRPEFRDLWPGGAPNIFQDWPVRNEGGKEVIVEPWVAE